MISNDCHSEAIELKYISTSNARPNKKLPLFQVGTYGFWQVIIIFVHHCSLKGNFMAILKISHLTYVLYL